MTLSYTYTVNNSEVASCKTLHNFCISMDFEGGKLAKSIHLCNHSKALVRIKLQLCL